MGGGNKDNRYKKTEEKFLAVFFDNPNCTMKQLSQKAGLARSTVYTHYHSIYEIVPDCKKNVLMEYKIMIDKKMQVETKELKMFYLEILIFIMKNRQIFEIFVKFGDREVLMEMILKLKPKIELSEKILKICVAEITEVIFEWGERGFSDGEIGGVLSDMMFLTLSARERLGPIAY